MTERRPDDRSRVAEALAAGTAADRLRDVLARAQAAPSFRLAVEGITVAVPRRAFSMFVDLLEDVSEGRDVTIAPADVVVGTTEASRVLGVSRTWAAKLVDDGKLASEVRGTKRRVHLGSLMARRRSDAARLRHASKALGESLDVANSRTSERRAADFASAALWSSALWVAQPRAAKLTPEHSTYIDDLTAGAGAPPAHESPASHEPTLAA
jgi:hypothetical protein